MPATDASTAQLSSSTFEPFRSRDFRLLYLTNLCEFFAVTLSRLAALQWLFEATNDGRALGGLGVVTLFCQLPSIALGGVLADTLDRKLLVSRVQSAALAVAFVRFALCWADVMAPSHIYITVGLLEVTSRLESSARGASNITAQPRSNPVDEQRALLLAPYRSLLPEAAARCGRCSLLAT